MKKASKALTLALALIMSASLLTACGGSSSAPASSAAETEAAETVAAETAAAETEAAAESAAESAEEVDEEEEVEVAAEESGEDETLEDIGAGEGGVITFGTNAEFPPFEFVTSEGVIDQYDGIDMAIADQIASEYGMEAQINNMEFDSLLLALENGQIDAVMAGWEGQPAIVFRRLMDRFQQNADTINRKLGEIGEAVQISGKEYDKNEQEQADQMSRIEGLLEG